ncbi:mobile mystery protein B [Breoghania sp. L-A4]|uniref:mobile mystery protein B n=1 Tax=Breoghania sp. L-A4 TaxID=2304600 RepID=UPI000E35F79E|nr:mobile mystery protein B [Breoghania sp. L-A4]AXS41900.1 mobile mystery protein B [Breoghania sp. L-A4]
MAGDPDGATPLDPDDAAGLRFPHVTIRAELNELEQANVADGLRWLARRRGGDILSEPFVRLLHKRLFGEVWTWAGSYRQSESNIGIDPRQIPVQVHMLLDDARFWVNSTVYSPLEAAARFHHRLVQIHLFANGNGRHARIAADLLLEDHFRQPRIDWAAGEDLQNDSERRRRYIAALRAADNHDFTALLRFVGA